MAKYSTECKLKVVQEYLAGHGSYETLSKRYHVPRTPFQRWVKAYKTFGVDGLKPSHTKKIYTFECKVLSLGQSLVFSFSGYFTARGSTRRASSRSSHSGSSAGASGSRAWSCPPSSLLSARILATGGRTNTMPCWKKECLRNRSLLPMRSIWM